MFQIHNGECAEVMASMEGDSVDAIVTDRTRSYQPTLDHAEKVNRSIKQMQLASAMSERYYEKPLLLCYSGGKDSDVLVELALMSGIDFEVQHSRTTVDAPETIYHVYRLFDRLKAEDIHCFINKPTYKGERTSMWKLIPQKQMPPTRLVRYCCKVLKETGGKNRAIATGVRKSESVARRNRVFANNFSQARPAALDFEDAASLFEDAENTIEHDDNFIRSCRIKGKTSFQPIIEWLDDDVWQFIDEQDVEVNPLYADGFNRIGCIGCPFASIAEREREFERWPKYRDAYMRAFAKMLKHRRECGLETQWETPEEVFDWWMSR